MTRAYTSHQRHARHEHPRVRVAILSASDSRTKESDDSGALLEKRLKPEHDIAGRVVSLDDVRALRKAARPFLSGRTDVLVVNGGTGASPRDVTIEAFRPLFRSEFPGFGEQFRMLSARKIKSGAWLSRATAGIIETDGHRVLVFLLPGSPDACRLAVEKLIAPELAHAVTLMRGERPHA